MNIRGFFSGREQSRRFRARQASRRPECVRRLENLEPRTMLAGNVTAQFLGQNAFINGDNADNSVEVRVEAGNVIVRGIDGTTINGGAADFVLTGGTSMPRHLSASLGGGNDTFVVTGVSIGRNLSIDGGAGNDRIAITGSSAVGRHLAINGATGNDIISLQNSTVGRNVALNGSWGDDMIVVSGAMIGRDLWIVAGAGSDDVVVDNSRIGRDTRIAGWGGDDDIIIRNSELVDDLSISGHGGHDIIMIDSSTVGDKSWINAGFGTDNIMIQGSTRFFDRLRTFGGPGRDNIEATPGVVFDGFKRNSFSGFTADAGAIATRITNTTTGALAAAQAALGVFGGELTLSINNTSVSEGAGDRAATLTVARTGNIDAALNVTLTSSNENKLRLEQTQVTIPAGQSSISVFVNPQNNTIVDGSTVVTVTASALNLSGDSLAVTVTDDDSDTLMVSFSTDRILEDSGNVSTVGAPLSFSYTVSRTGSTTSALVVGLSTSLGGHIVIPPQVTIPAGQSSVTFSDGRTVADGNVDGDVTVVLTASATGFQAGTDTLVVQDNDDPRLTVDFAAPTLTESGTGATTSATISRNTNTTNALSVTVTSQDPASLTINGATSQNVVIPAGQPSVTVTILGVNESIDDGDVPVAVFATSGGFTDGSNTITVLDNDAPTLSIILPEGDTVTEDSGTDSLRVRVTRNSGDISSELNFTLTATGDSRITGPSAGTIAAGARFADVLLSAVDNNIVDRPADGTVVITASSPGFTPGTIEATVTNDDPSTISFALPLVTVGETSGTSNTVQLTRTDSFADETITLLSSNTSIVTVPATVQFLAGETTKTITLNVTDNSLFAANPQVTIIASGTGHADVSTTIEITNDEVLALTAVPVGNTSIQSVGTVITKAETYTISGVTAPNATVQADNDGNGAFDEASVVADSNGDYTIIVPLTRNVTNRGANVVRLRAIIPAESVSTTSAVMNVHRSVGTVVRFQTNQDFDNDTNLDFYDVELLDAAAPITVANFLSYTTTTATGTERFDNLLLQRSDDNFIVQAGRFNINGQAITEIDRDADNNGQTDTIQNEFNTANSNVRGTLSMALPSGQPNGGSSEWFVNTGANTFLDDPSRLHTVFGRVVGSGMTVVDALNQVPVFDLNRPFNQGALGETPLTSSPLTPITGTIALGLDSAVVTGTGTLFTSELLVGDFIEIGNTLLSVLAITSDTQLTVDVQASSTTSGLTARLFLIPQNSDYLIFTNIGEILDSI